jgi:hypothetical protein
MYAGEKDLICSCVGVNIIMLCHSDIYHVCTADLHYESHKAYYYHQQDRYCIGIYIYVWINQNDTFTQNKLIIKK